MHHWIKLTSRFLTPLFCAMPVFLSPENIIFEPSFKCLFIGCCNIMRIFICSFLYSKSTNARICLFFRSSLFKMLTLASKAMWKIGFLPVHFSIGIKKMPNIHPTLIERGSSRLFSFSIWFSKHQSASLVQMCNLC